jgi:hypothetical protein
MQLTDSDVQNSDRWEEKKACFALHPLCIPKRFYLGKIAILDKILFLSDCSVYPALALKRR